MVERTGPKEGQAINTQYQIKSFNATHARVVIALMPTFGDEFPKRTVPYLSTVLNIHSAYLEEVLNYLVDKRLLSTDGMSYFLEIDNINNLDNVISRNPIVLLRKKLDVYTGTNTF